MSLLKVFGGLLSVCLLAACASNQSGSTGTATTASAASYQSGGAAAALNINVTNTIVRVSDLENKGALRRELDDFKSGLYWTRGSRPTDAVINIGGEGDVSYTLVGRAQSQTFAKSELFGTVSLVDAATGDVVVEPIFIKVSIGDDRDARNIGLTDDTKRTVTLEYLVQKFVFQAREALYGPGR